MAKRPKTGEVRKTKQPLKIDRLPAEVHDAIQFLYTVAGKSWIQIEAQSALPFDKDWKTTGRGFVPWDDLQTTILELFPELRLPHSNLHRWFDLRIAQVRQTTLARAEQARVLAESFADAKIDGDKDAVLYAARDIFFGILSEDGSLAARAAAGKALLALAKEQQKSRTNDIRERQVAVDEQVIQMKLDEIKRKAGELVKDAEAPDAPKMTREEVISRVKEIYGVA